MVAQYVRKKVQADALLLPHTECMHIATCMHSSGAKRLSRVFFLRGLSRTYSYHKTFGAFVQTLCSCVFTLDSTEPSIVFRQDCNIKLSELFSYLICCYHPRIYVFSKCANNRITNKTKFVDVGLISIKYIHRL